MTARDRASVLHRLGMAAVRAVWEAGLAAGGKDDGEPAQRAEFGPSTSLPTCATPTATGSRSPSAQIELG